MGHGGERLMLGNGKQEALKGGETHAWPGWEWNENLAELRTKFGVRQAGKSKHLDWDVEPWSIDESRGNG